MAFLFVKWLTLSLFGLFHPFYVSVTEINHNANNKTIEISCKIFSEDLEKILRKNYKAPVDLANEKLHPLNNKLIQNYFLKNLSVNPEGKVAKLNYIGFEKESAAVYCYFEITNISSIKKLDITNSILQDFSDQQTNIMHVMVNGKRTSTKLDYPKKQASFNF
jgi:hypothetical protein